MLGGILPCCVLPKEQFLPKIKYYHIIHVIKILLNHWIMQWLSRYMSHYTMLPKYGNCLHLLQKKQAENQLFFKVEKNSQYFVGIFK